MAKSEENNSLARKRKGTDAYIGKTSYCSYTSTRQIAVRQNFFETALRSNPFALPPREQPAFSDEHRQGCTKYRAKLEHLPFTYKEAACRASKANSFVLMESIRL